MALCNLCQTIPFSSLPSIPEYQECSARVNDSNEMPEFMWRINDKPFDLEDPIGFAWHKDLDALAKSATSGCPLCAVVQCGLEIWLGYYREAEKNPAFIEFHKTRTPIPNGQTLWLMKRIGGGDGFIVLARNPNTKSSCYLLTGISFSVEADSVLASKFPLRPIERNSGSEKSLDAAALLLNKCIEEHEQCTRGDTQLPSRILDVGSTGDVIKLIDCHPGMKGKYISLSHCWGSSETLTTTRESYEARISGISLSHLPKTYLDAVIIARHLGIRYIWIDSLCIMQEDHDDWARESGRMAEVYSNAYLTIAANQARDGTGGCFHDRPSRPKSTVNLPGIGEVYAQLLYPGDEWSHSGTNLEQEPLSQRGWALQERVLGRCVLHYNARQISLECDHGIMGEDGSSFDQRYCCNLRDLGKNQAPELPIHKYQRNSEYTTWNSLLWAYGRRKLTKPTDKLPAMSGLAKLLKSRTGAEYVAGLWSDNLIEGLAWQGIGSREPASTTTYTGPSWSWASYDGIAATGLRRHLREWKDVAKVEDWHIELQNEQNPFGEVKNAWIRVHGPLTPLTPSKIEIADHEPSLIKVGRTPLPRLTTRYSQDEKGQRVTPDHDDIRDPTTWRKMELQVLVLTARDKTKESETTEIVANQEPELLCYGLVVTPAGVGQDSRMRRVGWMFLEGDEAKRIIENKEGWKSITLV